MNITLPDDCGNAPRMVIVGDFVSSWAQRDADAVARWVTNDADWSVLGRELPEASVSSLEVTTIITHGRLASCDGVVVSHAGRIAFSHVLHFASTSKSAKITRVRTYLADAPA